MMGCTAVLGAQSSARATASPTTSNRTQEITLVGCLMPGNQSTAVGTSGSGAPAATAGAAVAHPTASTFILGNATMNNSAAAAGSADSGVNNNADTHAAGIAGGVGTSGTSGSGSYVLQGSDLTSQVGQKVEVRGMLLPAAKPSTRRSSRTAAPAEADATASMQHVRVTSVRMLAADCSGGAVSPAPTSPDRSNAPNDAPKSNDAPGNSSNR
jgi:hypothetical protein